MSDTPEESIAVLRGEGLVPRTYVDADVDSFVDAIRESAESVGRADDTTDEAIVCFATCRAARTSDTAHEYGIFDAATGRFLGGAGLNRIDRAHRCCNLGYWVRASAQRRGVASGAVRILLREALGNVGMRRVEIVVAVGNTASEGVARHAGGLLECIARNRGRGRRRLARRIGLLVRTAVTSAGRESGNMTPMVERTNDRRSAPLTAWIGRSETLHDVVGETPVAALAATLDDGNPVPARGEPLPPLWHWLYFLPRPRRAQLGPDGHAARGGFLPPVPLPRRMWAGGRLEWLDAIRVGDAIERVSRVEDVTTKSGRSGDLVFVRVRHTVSTMRGVALIEEHDIVYRDVPPPGSSPPAPAIARSDESWVMRIEPDDVLLFRYSALTFNGHRIHYDRRYVTEVEGYPGLIVHGPLIATLLVELLRRHRPDATLAHFEFRAVSPLFDIAAFDVCGRPADDGATIDLWARRLDGGLAMTATAMLVVHEDAP